MMEKKAKIEQLEQRLRSCMKRVDELHTQLETERVYRAEKESSMRLINELETRFKVITEQQTEDRHANLIAIGKQKEQLSKLVSLILNLLLF